MGTIEFHEGAARSAAAQWEAAAETLRSVAETAAGLTDEPYGHDKVGAPFGEKYEPARDDSIASAKNEEKTVGGVEPAITHVANAYLEQTRNLT